jgi:hypothetical protein
MASRLYDRNNDNNNDDGDGYANNDTHLNMANEQKNQKGRLDHTFMSFHLSHIEFVMRQNQISDQLTTCSMTKKKTSKQT